jgi:hypothetical protein
MNSTYPKGLLSFLYNVLYSSEINKQFHADPQKTMQFFGLSGNAEKAIVSYDKSQLDDLLAALKDELQVDRAQVW